MKDILQIQIINKAGRIVPVPLKVWENGMKLDTDWDIYEAPKPKVVAPATPVIVELKQPIAPVKPIVKKKRKGK